MNNEKTTIEIGKKVVAAAITIVAGLLTTAIVSLFAYVVSTNDRLVRMEIRQDTMESTTKDFRDEMKLIQAELKTLTYQQAKIIQLLEAHDG